LLHLLISKVFIFLHPFTRSARPESVILVQPWSPRASKSRHRSESDFRDSFVMKRQPDRCNVLRSWQPCATDDTPLSESFLQYDTSRNCSRERHLPIEAKPVSVIPVPKKSKSLHRKI